MSDLTNSENRKLEMLLGMSSGYVLDFSNRTFPDFVFDSTGREINDPRYAQGGSSKANRLRCFWKEEGNHVVGKLLEDILGYCNERPVPENNESLFADCRRIVARLNQETLVPELDVLTSITSERDFDAVAKEVRESIEKNNPESGLDRLHTFTTKYIRSLCVQRGVPVDRDKALHSLFGEYVKRLREGGYLQSAMTERILRSSISVLDAFNHVRNDQSLAHDNPVLNYEEALLVFNHIAPLIRFLRSVENRIRAKERGAALQESKDIPS